jgi:glucose/arabinose dehydrogenase
MFINDVGTYVWEEINPGAPAANYGWPASEGQSTNPAFVSPVFAYKHPNPDANDEGTTGCSITGGAFYDPVTPQFPASFVGKYFFADFCHNWIRVFDPATRRVSDFARSLRAPVDLEVGPDGALYYLSYGLRDNPARVGAVVRFRHTG